MIPFSNQELERYHRHFMITGFGLEGQRKLKDGSVLIVGCGGLGSPLLLYLAAAGVGRIGIIDPDIVTASNLQRQVLFEESDIGRPKVQAAAERISKLNPHITLDVYEKRLDAGNALAIIDGYDVVADGTDNFAARYLINDACVLLGKADVYAAVLQFEGQVSVFNHVGPEGVSGPNYRDLYPAPPRPGQVPDCATAGVLGVLPGIIGSLQALEVIKILSGIGDPLSGRLYLFDALSFSSRIVNFKRSPANPLNGKEPTIHSLVDYEAFCNGDSTEPAPREISAAELKDWQARGEHFHLIDVREEDEYRLSNIGAQLIPLSELAANVHLIPKDRKVVIHCQSGVRSLQAIRQLRDEFGLSNLYHLKGGILSYLEKRD